MMRATRATRAIAALTIAMALMASSAVRAETRARATSPSAERSATASGADVRARGDATANADVNEVMAFMEKARAELLVSLASDGSARGRATPTNAATPGDWVATFFSEPVETRRRAAGRSSTTRTRTASALPDIVIDENAIAFYNAAREFAMTNSVTNPSTGRMTIAEPRSGARAGESPYQWWYDFMWLTQRRYIDCETDADCMSIFHRGEGTICCAAGADYWGHTHNSCVDNTEECVATCLRPVDIRTGDVNDCESYEYCCKRRNGKKYDVCVDRFVDCDDYCDPHGEHQCKNDEQCCYVAELGYTICVAYDDLGVTHECPEPPRNCEKTDVETRCRENPDRMCCGGQCCDEGYICCEAPGFMRNEPIYYCFHKSTPETQCPIIPEPQCRTQQDVGEDCVPNTQSHSAVQPVCCGDPNDPEKMVCCVAGASYCCPPAAPTRKLLDIHASLSDVIFVCSASPCGAPNDDCNIPDQKMNLESCGLGGLCCGIEDGTRTCCNANQVCCPTFDSETGLVIDLTCKAEAQCDYPLCGWPGSKCPNNQLYSVCGGCGNGNGACEKSCDVCISSELNPAGFECSIVDESLSPPVHDLECVFNGMGRPPPLEPDQINCSCNNGMCGGARTVGCKGSGPRGNCCACQGSGMGSQRGGCKCNVLPP